ncbi:TetR/AcrR family transcriptional regulator [Rhodococcus rhodochrous]|uniref:TetR family transcriptional regulator n=1 Tax=Rhodococcus rhodochrous KG-21 TaxID=1441923 RepID=A0A0M8PKD1_RHORH|nr:TetR/AcrR family transcriptional regulator [Rhodococcus rhodochrous]KOS53448.1 TetR family transcriptional regulator [Rhodococcus rhodochrous KG-21]
MLCSMPPRSTRRSDAARTAILTAAVELVGEVGYSKSSIEAIATRAGVGKQTIYRWWSSKGSVLLDAYLNANVGGEPEDPQGLPNTGDLVADMRAVLRATVDELNDPRFERPLRALTVAVLEDESLAAEYSRRLDEPTRQMKKERLRAAQRQGQLSPDVDLDAVVDTLFAPVAQRWLLRSGPLTYEYTDHLVETVLTGLPRPGS